MFFPLLTGYAFLVIMMMIIWLVFRRMNNAAIVDCGWGFGFVVLGLVYAALAGGALERRILVSTLMVLWGGRLALHLLTDRILSGKPEDGRYQEFRVKWENGINARFFAFFQAQALLVALFSVPMLLSASNANPAITPLEWVGVGVWCIGIAGEATADRQLRRFKDDPVNRGRTCQAGLWRYSRHPNYFFEWVIWIAFSLVALDAPWGVLGLLAPTGMLYILLRVTGVALTERHALTTRGAEYREYQRTTSVFVPLPRRNRRTGVA